MARLLQPRQKVQFYGLHWDVDGCMRADCIALVCVERVDRLVHRPAQRKASYMRAGAPNNLPAHLQPGDNYVQWAIDNPVGYRNRTGVYKTRVEWEFIRRFLPSAPAQVFDLAGGSGRFALRLLDDGYAVTVNDIHEPSLRLLEERAGENQPTIVHGAFLKSNIEGSFDAAMAMECLDRMPFDETVHRVHDLLRPGGVFVFTVLNRSSWRFALRRLAGREARTEFVERFENYRAAWQLTGFKEIGVRGLMWTLLTVSSDSPLVPLFAGAESLFCLHAWASQSPWNLVALQRA